MPLCTGVSRAPTTVQGARHHRRDRQTCAIRAFLALSAQDLDGRRQNWRRT